jgi:hypothetical protein
MTPSAVYTQLSIGISTTTVTSPTAIVTVTFVVETEIFTVRT